jgi:hypothetical protein
MLKIAKEFYPMTNPTTEALRMSWVEVCARRLARHALVKPAAAGRLAEQVGVVCGVHAQVISAAELSIGLRVAGVTRVGVQQALWSERSLVKTFGPRGTVHLLSALPHSRNVHAQDVRLSPDQTDEIVEAIATALNDAELTIDELNEAIIERTGPWAGDPVMPAFNGMWPRWRQVVDTAANRGVLCFGPNRGRKVTYTNPCRWLPGFRPADEQSSVAALVRRYLYAYGPATPQQFAQWLNAPRRWATELFDSLAAELQQVEVAGALAWLAAGDSTAPNVAPQCVRLLPYFDAYVVGCHPREKLFSGRAAERALAGGQAGNFPVLLIDGTVAGVWHHRRSGRKLDIRVEPFGQLTAWQRRELDEQVERIGEILEGKPDLTIGEVTVGAHA